MTANGEWPIVGAALGFPPSLPDPVGDPTGVPLSHCAPVVAHRLQQLYQDTLRHFDQAYASIRSNNSQTFGRVPPRLQQQPEVIPQPTEVEHEVLLANVTVPSEAAAPLTSSPWFNPRAGQNLTTLQARIGFPQGQVSLQPSFSQPSPSVPLANIQPSSTPSTSQPPPPPGQQVPAPSTNFTDLPLPQLRVIYAQMVHTWMEGEKNFQASNASGGEGELQRRQQRHKLDAYKQRVHALQECINNKARARWVILSLLVDIL